MPEYIASKLALLPQFEVESLGRRTGEYGRLTLLSGYFSEDVGNDENGAYLYLPDLRFLDGLLLAATEGDFLRTIEVSGYSWSDISERGIVGTTLAFFGAHDSRRLELVIEPESNWTKAEFKPQKAIQSYIIGTD